MCVGFAAQFKAPLICCTKVVFKDRAAAPLMTLKSEVKLRSLETTLADDKVKQVEDDSLFFNGGRLEEAFTIDIAHLIIGHHYVCFPPQYVLRSLPGSGSSYS